MRTSAVASVDVVVPEEFICPITKEIFFDPVLAEDGYTFEREAIVEYLKQGGTSPITREKLSIADLKINRIAKNMIEKWLIQNPDKWADVYESETLLSSLFATIKEKQLSRIAPIESILDKDPRLLTRQEKGSGYTAWHRACHAEFGSSFMVEKFLEILQKEQNQHHLARLLEIVAPTDFNPTHANCALKLALNKGDIDSASLLFKLGATDITQLSKEDGITTLFHRVVMLENPQTKSIFWLLEKMSFKHDNQEDYNNEKLSILQPLHLAVVLNDLVLLNTLLTKNICNPGYIDAQDADGNTALHLAAKLGKDLVIPMLIRAGANHKLRNNQRLTATKVAEIEDNFASSNLIATTVHEINFQTRKMLCLYVLHSSRQSSAQDYPEESNSANSSYTTTTTQTPGGP